MFSTHRKYPYYNQEEVDKRYVQLPPYVVDNDENREDSARFNLSAKYADKAFKIVIDALKNAGVYEETLVIFTTDHGLANPFNKCNLTDAGTGVSLIIKVPYNGNKGEVSDALVSHLDIYPTICDILSIEKPEWLQGKSLIDIINKKVEEVNDEIFTEVNFHTSYEPIRGVRTKRFKYVKYYDTYNKINYSNIDDSSIKEHLLNNGLLQKRKDMEALYDLFLDPYEKENLIEDIKYKDILEELKSKLLKWQEETNDIILNGSITMPKKSKVNKCDCISTNTKKMDDYVHLPE